MIGVGKFIEQLEENLRHQEEIQDCKFESKQEYIGNTVFDFTTYDGELTEFIKNLLEWVGE